MKKIMNRWKQYVIPYSKQHSIPKCVLLIGYLFNYVIYRCSIRDYFTLNFPYLGRRGKHTFITAIECSKYYRLNNDKEQIKILDDKEEMLKFFGPYIGRDWCGQKYNNTREEYETFLSKNPKFILKPLNGSGGHGIKLETCDSVPEGVYEYCKKHNACIEELIIQHDSLSRLFPYSVNTIRIFTYKSKVVGAVLRVGTGKSFLDNASSGGLFAPIDLSIGVVIDGAFTFEVTEKVITHPDTKIVFPGFVIPYWNECKKIVMEAAELVSGIPLVGWDVAVTNAGPVLIEANSEPEIPLLQIPAKTGIRNIIEL